MRPFEQSVADKHSTQLPLALSHKRPPKPAQSALVLHPVQRCALPHCGTMPPQSPLDVHVVVGVGAPGMTIGGAPIPGAGSAPGAPVEAPVAPCDTFPATPVPGPVPAVAVPPAPELVPFWSTLWLALHDAMKLARSMNVRP